MSNFNIRPASHSHTQLFITTAYLELWTFLVIFRMFEASDVEKPPDGTADCPHVAGLHQQSRGRLRPWRRGGHRQQQGRDRGRGDGVAEHVDQRLLGNGHQGPAVTQVLQAAHHPHVQVSQSLFPLSVTRNVHYKFGCRTIFSPLQSLLADTTHVRQEEIFTHNLLDI